MTERFGKTYKGRTVKLNETEKVEGGMESYVLNGDGFAVKVFVPTK